MLQRPTTESLRVHTSGARRSSMRRTIRSLLTPAQLNQAILRESARVDRKTDGVLVLVLFRLPASPSAPATRRLAKTVLHRIRVTDDVGWYDQNHIGVLLPDTSPSGAWRLAQHVCDREARRSDRPHVTMYSYGGDARSDAAAAPSVIRQTDELILPKAN